MSRERGDWEYTEELCDDARCRDVAVIDMGGMYEGLCVVHLNEAYKAMEADRQIKWLKENGEDSTP